MKQVILVEPGKIEIREVPVPEPSAGEVVIRVNTALTCGTDLKAYGRGHKLIPMPGPFGHEYSGTVSHAGSGAGFKEGDDVMGVHSAPCFECEYCRKGLQNLCEVIMERKALGAFSEYLLLPEHIVKQNLFHKPSSIGFEEAALLEPFSCVVHPYRRLKMREIENALIIGAGPIGLMHVSYLKMRNIRVMVSDNSEERLWTAMKAGADRVALPGETAGGISEATHDLGADLVVECTGRETVWEESVRYARRGGVIILFGGCPADTTVTFDSHRLHYDELTLMGSFHYTTEDVKDAYQILAGREINVSALISGKFPLADIEKAFALLKEGKGIKYALKP